jgi:RND family efflux transporter MFP subunit
MWVVLCSLVACAEEAPPPELPPRAIQWMRVSVDEGQGHRIISGIVTAVSDTKLAFEVKGNVATVDAALGDQVKKGQVLASLDPEPLELAVRDAEANLASAKASFQDASVSFDRARVLFEQDVASAAERDRAEARYDSAQSSVEAGEARLALEQRDLRRSVLRAPFDGAISVRDVEPAQNVFSGQVVFEMDSGESGLRAEVQVPETLITKVFQGQKVEVSFPSMSSSYFPAVISEVGTRAADGNAFTVKADLVERIEDARPGMTAEVRFSYQKSTRGVVRFEGFMIPIAALQQGMDGQMSVFVYDKEPSTVRKVSVVSGGIRDNEVAILEGLGVGDIIATAGVSFLRDGQTVALLE